MVQNKGQLTKMVNKKRNDGGGGDDDDEMFEAIEEYKIK